MGSFAIPKIDERSKRGKDGFVRIDVDMVFHRDVLKPLLPKGNVSYDAPGIREETDVDGA